MATPDWIKKELRSNFARASRTGRQVAKMEPRAAGATMYLWSAGGAGYARSTATDLGIADCLSGFLPKPTIIIDDRHITEWRSLRHFFPTGRNNPIAHSTVKPDSGRTLRSSNNQSSYSALGAPAACEPMLSFDSIASLVQAQYRSVLLRDPRLSEAVRLYKNGGDGNPGWLTVGMYSYLDSDSRLVFESMYVARFDACVTRIFQEHPVRFFYQRKAIGDLDTCRSRVTEAVDCFQLHLPQKLLRASEHSAELAWPGIEQLMLPIPPPCKLEDLPE